MTRIQASAILFDLDGTLVDSTASVIRVWRRWAERHGVDPERLLSVAHGRPAIDTMREFRPDLPDLESHARAHVEAEEVDTDGIVAIPGAREVLSSLPPDRWAIVTSCPPRLAQVRREAAGLPRPRIIVTAADIKHAKPAPDCYLLAAKLLDFEPHNCLVVEDAPAGIQAGLKAGMSVLALTTTHSQFPIAPSFTIPDLSAVSARFQDQKLSLEIY